MILTSFHFILQLRRFLKSVTSQRTELFCPRNLEGRNFITKQTEKKVACGEEYDLCQDNNDCEPGLLCCPSACIYKCVLPQKPKSAIGKLIQKLNFIYT